MIEHTRAASENSRATTVSEVLRQTTTRERFALALTALFVLVPLIPWQTVKDWVG